MSSPHFTNRPLAGCTVVVTAERRAAELGAALDRRGAEVVHAPVLSMVSHVDDETLLSRTREVLERRPDVVVVTTGVGFRGWLEAATAAGLADPLLEVLGDARLVARGPKAVGAIHAAGLAADWVAESETSAEIQDLLLLEGVSGLRVAVQHHGAGADGLDDALAAAGAQVTSLVVYRWGPPPDPAAVVASVHTVADRQADAVVFTSAPGTWAWLEAARTQGRLDDVVSACTSGAVIAAAVGPVTAQPLRDAGIEPVVPDRYRLGALVHSLTSALVARTS
ncbi:uroporphyrinogen-III synthase [Angustibacter sp. McL0619]|uniref:uroporphyrinogen-III synthase n=1 Tax=Angustibacter sp. McL0619 TaxID=3415676 RepID=UPI003CF3A3DE